MKRRTFLTRSTEVLALAGTAATAGANARAGEGGADQPGSAGPPPEAVIDPDLPIVDAHHHLWDHPNRHGEPRGRYLLADFLADVAAGGHNITDTVFVECMTMYRAGGPVEMRSLGETEFANGIAAMSASGAFGPCRVAAGIVAFVDLRLGDAVEPVLESHLSAAKSRLKGVRNPGAWDPYPVMGIALDPARARWLADPGTRRGVALLGTHGLVFETWIFHPQIPQLAVLAAEVPGTTIILGHVGTPIGVGPYASHARQTFDDWKAGIRELARRPNVVVKLGGLGMSFVSPALSSRSPQAGSTEIAQAWRPFIETCIEAFGAERCMFESNYPPDAASCSYRTLWNAFKRITAGCSASERTALFSGTARRVLRLADA